MNEIKSRLIPSYGRCKNRRLGSVLSEIYDNLLDTYLIKLDTFPNFISKNNDLGSKFSLEIGFGSGGHIMDLITTNLIKLGNVSEPEMSNPDYIPHFYIGCEVFINGIAKLLASINLENEKIHPRRINNFGLWNRDVRFLLNIIPDNSIDEIFVLFPDPWPKNKQKKRRILNSTFLNSLKRIAKNNAIMIIATDSQDYSEDIRKLLSKELLISPDSALLMNVIKTEEDVKRKNIYTKYARKALIAGSEIYHYEVLIRKY